VRAELRRTSPVSWTTGFPCFSVANPKILPGRAIPRVIRFRKVGGLALRNRSARNLGTPSADRRGGIVYEELFRRFGAKPQNCTCWTTGEPCEGIPTNQLGLDRYREHRENERSGVAGVAHEDMYDGKQALLTVPVKTGRGATEPGITLCREEAHPNCASACRCRRLQSRNPLAAIAQRAGLGSNAA
jgi:hypothetical protein